MSMIIITTENLPKSEISRLKYIGHEVMALVYSEIHPQMNYINLLSLIGHEILPWTKILTESTDRCTHVRTPEHSLK